jgi:hypothetical protein
VANVNKSNGTRWESLVAGYLNEYGLEAERTGSASADEGDIHAGEWTIEAKAEAKIDLPGYLKQLSAAVGRREGGYAFKSAVMVKNRRHSIQDGYAVMSIENYRALMLYVNAMEGTLREVLEQVEGAQDVRAK